MLHQEYRSNNNNKYIKNVTSMLHQEYRSNNNNNVTSRV